MSDGSTAEAPGVVVMATRPAAAASALAQEIHATDHARVALLCRMLAALRVDASPDEVASIVLGEALEAFPPSTHATLARPGDGSGWVVTHHRRRGDITVRGDAPGAVSGALLDRVASERSGVLFVDALVSHADRPSIQAGQIRSCLCAPLVTAAGLVGVLQVDCRTAPRAFAVKDLELLVVFAGHAATVLDNVALRTRLEAAEARLRRENADLRETLSARLRTPGLVGDSPAMREVFRHMQIAAAERLPLLIEGETGTGKEVIARNVHGLGERGRGAFVPINCGAVPKELLESELFGHVRGAYTGAATSRVGLFAEASGGTLFLDEVGELPLDVQVKLLRVLEERAVRPVGSDRLRDVDVRIVAATNRRLEEEVAAGRFRADLFFRLAVLRLRLPPLRDRPDDIPALAQQFLEAYNREGRKAIAGFAPDAIAVLLRHSWPGNARELRNAVERAAAATAPGERIHAATVSLGFPDPAGAAAEPAATPAVDLRVAVEALERRMIEGALRETSGHVSLTARRLGLSRLGLRQKMARYGLSKSTYKGETPP